MAEGREHRADPMDRAGQGLVCRIRRVEENMSRNGLLIPGEGSRVVTEWKHADES